MMSKRDEQASSVSEEEGDSLGSPPFVPVPLYTTGVPNSACDMLMVYRLTLTMKRTG